MDVKSRLNMIYELNRQESFKVWPYKNKSQCNTKKMAEAGFFWTGTKQEPDSAQCFICNKQLDGWEPNDEPWKEHKKHSPACPFIMIGKAEDLLTLSQLYDLHKIMIKLVVAATANEIEQNILQDLEEFKDEIKNNYINM